jgi:hypothetical protein
VQTILGVASLPCDPKSDGVQAMDELFDVSIAPSPKQPSGGGTTTTPPTTTPTTTTPPTTTPSTPTTTTPPPTTPSNG